MTEYRCIRCLYMTKIKTDMVKHLHKLKKCEHKHIDTLNLSDDNIIQQSLIPIHSYNNDVKKHECEIAVSLYYLKIKLLISVFLVKIYLM